VKKSSWTWSLAGMFALAGCAVGTSGGPGTMDPAINQPLIGQADETFRLSTGETALRQGETKSVCITIKRALNFDEDVTLGFSDFPTGLSVDNASPLIKHGDSEARFVLTATDDASLGDFSLRVTGHPTKGTDATNKLNITVNKK
jgi:hypothetical protein